jgi:20S proteasome alpha/beta subunit
MCNKAQNVVAVADRMVSVEFLSLQFEQHTRKVERIGEHFVALTAGDALGHTEIIRATTQEIARLSQPTVFEVASQVETCFIRARQNLAEKSTLRRVGLDYATFLEQQRNLSPELVSALMSEYQAVELDIELLLAGVDSTGGHLYQVYDPGIKTCFDSIGYTAIGSGLPHAESFLADADYSPNISLNRAIWLGYVAKRRSERAPGVGSRYTDVLVIDEDQGVQFLDGPTLDKLDSLYQQYVADLRQVTQTIDGSVADITLEFQQ